MSVFQTPGISAWPDILARSRQHLRAERPLAYLPNANLIWMQFGFELFTACRAELGAEVIEVYPHAPPPDGHQRLLSKL